MLFVVLGAAFPPVVTYPANGPAGSYLGLAGPPPKVKMPRNKPSAILKFFGYKHLPQHLQVVSAAFYALADELDGTLPDCAEKSAGLRKLLEAKDCMVRAALEKTEK